MSRRPATITQADVARALRAAQQVGPTWHVEIEGGVIRLIRRDPAAPAPTASLAAASVTRQPSSLAELPKWRL